MFALAALAAVLLIGSSGAARSAEARRPLTIAHRGANRLADENTLKAYQLAADYGVDFIECDPRLTADGVFVINHDQSLVRATGVDKNIPDLTLAEVRAIKTKNGETIPTLAEVFRLATDRGVRVFIDTKLHDVESMQKLVAAIADAGMKDRVVVQLWTHEQQKWMSKNAPDINTSLSYPSPLPSLTQVRKSGAEWVGMLYADDKALAQAAKLGLLVVTMPINDTDTMRSRVAAGLTILQTDDVVLLKEFMDQEFGPAAAPETTD